MTRHMEPQAKTEVNVQQAVPFFMVSSMEASLRFYVDGLGFAMTKKWTPDGDGKVRWCWLELGKAALMLQEFRKDHHPNSGRPEGSLGAGVSICFTCRDALEIYRQLIARGIEAQRPFVGNNMWVTSLRDPDGYRIDFESYTDAPEESVYAEGPA
ncbi:MAG TPA: VOC family protein [Verrucomicrobiae bacterium]|nr:VOC family protein [Verrucomicrobiae bacterium]